MKVLIGADLVPMDSNCDLFCAGDAERLVGKELAEILKGADYRIFNLEVPLTDSHTPIEKCGRAFRAPTSAVAGYRALGADCLTIANNHILDQGERGFVSTKNLLEANGIAYVGGGCNLQEAAKPYIVEIRGKRIGIYACAEHEFSIAGENTPGANPFDPLESPDHVAELKKQCDYVIVLYHGGKEYYRYPSPDLQKVCRKLVEKGADLVVCQHSHCIGCEEKYRHGTIVYGQGNFLFDHSTSEFTHTGLLIQIGDGFEITYLPLRKNGGSVCLADDREIMEQFHARSSEISDAEAVKKRYAEFAEDRFMGYIGCMWGKKCLIFRIINKLSGYRLAKLLFGRKYSQKNLLQMRNYIECEAHRELFLYALKNHQKE